MTHAETFADMFRRLGLAVTDGRMAFMLEWARFEGTPEGINNPLATTLSGSIVRRSTKRATDFGSAFDFGPGKWNNANPPYGVAIYDDPVRAGDATYRTIIGDGRYAPILDALTRERVANPGAVADALRVWGTTGFAEYVRGGYAPLQWASAPLPSPVTIERMNAALQSRFRLARLAWSEIGAVERAIAALEATGMEF